MWHWQLKKIDDSIEFMKSRPKPLAIYAFTEDDGLRRRILSETSSGSVIFNDALIQVQFSQHHARAQGATPALPVPDLQCCNGNFNSTWPILSRSEESETAGWESTTGSSRSTSSRTTRRSFGEASSWTSGSGSLPGAATSCSSSGIFTSTTISG